MSRIWDRILAEFANISGTAYGLFALRVFVLVAVIFWWRRRIRGQHAPVWHGYVVCYVGFQVLVFSNPVFWTFSYRLLNSKDIGSRQKDALGVIAARFSNPDHKPVLAVGSSQTGAIYGSVAEESDRLGVLALSGMSLLDLNLYAEDIFRRQPRHIVLTLSEFDIGRPPLFTGTKLAPAQSPLKLTRLLNLTGEHGAFDDGQIADVVMAQLLMEYRYQFVFRGFVTKLSLKSRAEAGKQHVGADPDFQFAALAKLDRKWFELNRTLLDQFLQSVEDAGARVVIVEGQYHPRAERENETLRADTVAMLKKLTGKYPHAEFVPVSELKTFSESDYRDPYHVHREAGVRFANLVLNRLRAE